MSIENREQAREGVVSAAHLLLEVREDIGYGTVGSGDSRAITSVGEVIENLTAIRAWLVDQEDGGDLPVPESADERHARMRDTGRYG